MYEVHPGEARSDLSVTSNVSTSFLPMAGKNIRQHRAARIALDVSAGGVGACADAVSICRIGCDAGSAAAGRDHAAHARLGSGGAAFSLDGGGVRRDGVERR